MKRQPRILYNIESILKAKAPKILYQVRLESKIRDIFKKYGDRLEYIQYRVNFYNKLDSGFRLDSMDKITCHCDDKQSENEAIHNTKKESTQSNNTNETIESKIDSINQQMDCHAIARNDDWHNTANNKQADSANKITSHCEKAMADKAIHNDNQTPPPPQPQ